MKTKQCNRCKNLKTLEYFPTDKTGILGVRSMCKDCNRLDQRQKYQKGNEFYKVEEENALGIYRLMWEILSTKRPVQQ